MFVTPQTTRRDKRQSETGNDTLHRETHDSTRDYARGNAGECPKLANL